MLKVAFTDHALAQIKERGLSKIFVASAVRNPTLIKEQTDGRFKFIKTFRQGAKRFLLIAIVEREDGAVMVVTVFKTSKINKYL